MKISAEQVGQLIEGLCGTTNCLEEQCLRLGFNEDDLSIEDTNRIDEAIFLCESCGWWCPQDENCGEEKCEDCTGE